MTVLELKPKNNVGRICDHCGYVRCKEDTGTRKLCPSCKTKYSSTDRKTKRQTRGNSELYISCVAEKLNQRVIPTPARELRVNNKRRYVRCESAITAGSIMTWLGVSVLGVISAIIVKSYLGL